MNKQTRVTILKGFHSNTIWTNSFTLFCLKIALLYPVCNKTGYLANHSSQLRSYYGTLSGSHGRSFRIRQEKLREAPPNWEITMTSYPVCNKTSLSLKPCMAAKQLLWNTIRKSWSEYHKTFMIFVSDKLIDPSLKHLSHYNTTVTSWCKAWNVTMIFYEISFE